MSSDKKEERNYAAEAQNWEQMILREMESLRTWQMNWGDLFANNKNNETTTAGEEEEAITDSTTTTDQQIQKLERKLNQFSSSGKHHRIMTSSQLHYGKVKPYKNFGNDFKRKSSVPSNSDGI